MPAGIGYAPKPRPVRPTGTPRNLPGQRRGRRMKPKQPKR